jgi:hypothetical protein
MTDRHLLVIREFLEQLANDPWIEKPVKAAAKDALRRWDDVLYHGREHERSEAFQEAGEE